LFIKNKGGIELKVLRMFIEHPANFTLKRVVAAGIVSFIFLGIMLGIVGFVTTGIIRFFPFLNWWILLLVILILGVTINILGSQKFSDSNSFGIIMARSIKNFAENIVKKNQDAINADSVYLDDLWGISHLRNETRETDKIIMRGLLELIKNREMREQLKRRIREIEGKEDKKNYSASIYVLSASGGNGKDQKEVLASSSPTPATGFILRNVPKKWLHKKSLLAVVRKITSGALFSGDEK